MPQIITFPFLASINDAVSLAFNTQFSAADSRYKKFSFEGPSTGAATIYPRLDLLPGMREWLGDRVVHALSVSVFQITNKTFENTISVQRPQLEDDLYGILGPAAQQLGQTAGELPDLLIASLMKNGHTSITYDGQNFFDTAHPNPNADGSAGTIANYQAGSGSPWFLIDTRKTWRPFIYQMRRPYQMIPKFSMTDPQVFWNQEFEWGVDGRSNAGYGLWQTAFMSLGALSVANITAARTAMASIRRPNGTPMGIKPNLLVCGTSLYPDALALATNEFIPIDSNTGATTLGPNPLRGMFEAYEDEWLN
jgi:phage major head subunit gpT-like protein